MSENKYFVIDFDSTFVKIEALDTLAAIVLENNPQQEEIVKKIEEITKMGMDGKISFSDSLEQRLALFSPTSSDVKKLIDVLNKNISKSILENREWFKNNAEYIYIISGGFFEYIEPVVRDFGILNDHILANRFVYGLNGEIVGFDKDNYLAQKQGKVKQMDALNLDGYVTVIGDGFTDYEIRKNGKADKFVAFTENVSRDSVLNVADLVVNDFSLAI
jgi:D-3-phosphoglycerate dehydrogenase